MSVQAQRAVRYSDRYSNLEKRLCRGQLFPGRTRITLPDAIPTDPERAWKGSGVGERCLNRSSGLI
ncbi:MAG: hypothetical protein QOG10_6876 [Kribbellaceae bacterium]|jgi:hypothetical protein|nr:hypothetical protein [Kribbellaceae bacterium]